MTCGICRKQPQVGYLVVEALFSTISLDLRVSRGLLWSGSLLYLRNPRIVSWWMFQSMWSCKSRGVQEPVKTEDRLSLLVRVDKRPTQWYLIETDLIVRHACNHAVRIPRTEYRDGWVILWYKQVPKSLLSWWMYMLQTWMHTIKGCLPKSCWISCARRAYNSSCKILQTRTFNTHGNVR